MTTEGTAPAPAEATPGISPAAAEALEAVVAEEVAAAPEEAAPETAAETAAEAPTEKADRDARRFAALARKEKDARRRAEDVERREREMAARLKEIEERESRWNAAKTPLEALRARGFSYAQATEDALHQFKQPEKTAEELRFEAIEAKAAAAEQAKQEVERLRQEIQEKEQQVALNNVRQAIRATVNENNEKYELISTVGDEAYTLVFDVMAAYWNEHKESLNFDEACDIVESYYEDYAKKLAKSKKLAASTKPAAAPAPKPAQGAPAKTLRQADTSASSASPNVDAMSREDAIQFLAAKLNAGMR